MPAKKRKYNYMRSNAPANKPKVVPSPGRTEPWISLLQVEPVPGQRVVVSFLQEDGSRRYALGKWSITQMPPGIDKWMAIPDPK